MMHFEKNYTGNERFFGFCVDVLSRVANEVGFDYILDLVPDRKYGAQDPLTGEWNGMVLQLMKHVSLCWLYLGMFILFWYYANVVFILFIFF